jgi:hypothetical protein
LQKQLSKAQIKRRAMQHHPSDHKSSRVEAHFDDFHEEIPTATPKLPQAGRLLSKLSSRRRS